MFYYKYRQNLDRKNEFSENRAYSLVLLQLLYESSFYQYTTLL